MQRTAVTLAHAGEPSISAECRNGSERGEPILRWAGGKRQILAELQSYVPRNLDKCTYHEPFLGAASLFFHLAPCNAVLSDANRHLIQTYRWVRDSWELVADYLRRHARRTNETYYYLVRDQYNRSGFSAAQAARFIYLNKTCFNGIFRVNRSGQFNVPYGWKEPPAIPTADQLQRVSEHLKRATLRSGSYERCAARVSKGDFVYLDPPYPPLNGTAYFTHYTKECFSDEDQKRLAKLFETLSEMDCQVMMTNADTPKIRSLYRSYNLVSLSVTRFVTCKATRHTVKELVITNY